MKNILFVHSSSEMYGSDKSLLNIVKYINKNEFKVYVVLPCTGPLVDEMKKEPGVEVVIFSVAVLRRKNLSLKGGIQYLYDFVSSYRFLKSIIKKYKIDIVDTNTAVVFPGAVAAKHCKVKSVWHIREIIKNRMENIIISAMMNRYADLIVANSISTGNALVVDHSKVRVVYNAVEEKQKKGITAHELPTVGMAGRINRWKGQKLFVDAAAIVHTKMPEVIFKIAGDVYAGEDYIKQELKRYIAEKGLADTVILLGQLTEMDGFYNSLDLFVLPSIQPEPFGLVVLEAMEYGIPVIATKHGGPTEILEDGVDGYLVGYENANQLANRIIELMSNYEKRKEMGAKGFEKKRKCFSVSVMVRKIELVFYEVEKMGK